MPRISLALSEIIKRSLFRIREHLGCLTPTEIDNHAEMIAMLSFEVAHELGLPAVRSTAPNTPVEYHVADALRNLTTMIDSDLHDLNFSGDPEEIVKACRELLADVHKIPLPAAPPARTA
jgi:hypothetical protein